MISGPFLWLGCIFPPASNPYGVRKPQQFPAPKSPNRAQERANSIMLRCGLPGSPAIKRSRWQEGRPSRLQYVSLTEGPVDLQIVPNGSTDHDEAPLSEQ